MTADGRALRLRVLMSFWYYSKLDVDALIEKDFGGELEIFADSGAFSALTQNGTVDLEAYASWLKRWKHRFTAYANLDVIRNAEATLRNQKALEDKGLSPLPVFHGGSDFAYLERYLDSGYPYIALGGIANRKAIRHEALMPWLIKCFKLAKGRAVYHGFGVTSWRVMRDLPWYSVDSSSWGGIFRWGRGQLFDPRRGCFREFGLGERKTIYPIASLFRDYGFDPEDFADRARNTSRKNCALSALSYLACEEYLRRKWGAIELPAREAGAKLYLALGSEKSQGTGPRDLARYVAGDGIKLYLVDGSHQHYREASDGIKLYLVETAGSAVHPRRASSEIAALLGQSGGTT